MFFKGSRYEDVASDSITDAKGQVIRFKSVRFIPVTRARMLLTIKQDERLDQIAGRIYQDPERFWRICDANLAMWPDDLIGKGGDQIKIPPSEG